MLPDEPELPEDPLCPELPLVPFSPDVPLVPGTAVSPFAIAVNSKILEEVGVNGYLTRTLNPDAVIFVVRITSFNWVIPFSNKIAAGV